MNQIDSLVAALEPVTGMRQEPMGQPPKKPTAPRVTPADLEANIAGEYYFTGDSATCDCPQLPGLALLTFCVLVLRNGFTVTGESACVSPENFDAELGQKIARQNAVAKMWPLMGYALKQKLAEA